MLLVAVIACQSALVAVLPEGPVKQVGLTAYAPYPQGIVGEILPDIPEIDGEGAVYYGLYAVVSLQPFKEGLQYSLGLLERGLVRALVGVLLDVNNWRHIDLVPAHGGNEVIRLGLACAVEAEKVVSRHSYARTRGSVKIAAD